MTYPQAARALLRDTLLDAVAEQLTDRAFGEITMAGVAAGAGVSRQTLYNEFGSRPALAQAYVMREVSRFLDGVERAVLAHADDPHAAVTAAFGVFLTTAADHPLLKSLITKDGNAELTALITTGGEPVLHTATAFLTDLIVRTWPHVDPDAARLLSEAVTRLAISHAILPSAAPELTATAVERLLSPFITAETGLPPR
ncbi:putative transcriptional regulator, TetR family protein [Longispora fulva]|uniref:AcrR family transcriptional regulator n=1 Tax=Longispora fulva TaxID=619741 RepID=A0A8J7GJB4_9ACTN|nr:TetR family transcriptional regulator [Longispora fulva]MBG6137588.1 AcrR family transcriptional regulator [Longispora fulva]GIG61057.1 putative transcriptional regulator, TetR family protein [Longispora fulva]